MATVGERYQIVIERDAREKLGIRPGDRAVETVEGGRLVITFLPGPHRRSLKGLLAGPGRIEDFAEYRDSNQMSDLLAEEHRPQR